MLPDGPCKPAQMDTISTYNRRNTGSTPATKRRGQRLHGFPISSGEQGSDYVFTLKSVPMLRIVIAASSMTAPAKAMVQIGSAGKK